MSREDTPIEIDDDLSSPPEPTMKDMMRMLHTVIENTSDNKVFKATTVKRLDDIESKAIDTTERLQNIETKLAAIESKSASFALSSTGIWADQRKLRNNITITGLSQSDEEDLQLLVVDVCCALNVSIKISDIDAVYRVSSRSSNMIIVKFRNFETKMRLMKAKLIKKLYVNDIPLASTGTSDAVTQVYINSHVTPAVGQMLQRARTAVKTNLIASCWVTNNALMIKASIHALPLSLKSMDELNKLLDTGKVPSPDPKPSPAIKRKKSVNESISPKNERPPASKPRVNSRSRLSGPKSVKDKREHKNSQQNKATNKK